ncbi:MAG: hypothetical protein COW30_02890 [Rhodospirillales bacterium CG15_BIG_FIL_POST_REV_8_21_14_020_66_15]|nr:MAG: hypothetical protein COW30_02890 [Rhodospirillales bacterium CG15_BIG_FIL_POST_REV_8_21_14_020_66_15]
MARKLIKTGTYSVMHLTVAVAVAFALTRDWHIALGIGIIEPLVQTVAYTIHETLWGKVKDDGTKAGATAPATV